MAAVSTYVLLGGFLYCLLCYTIFFRRRRRATLVNKKTAGERTSIWLNQQQLVGVERLKQISQAENESRRTELFITHSKLWSTPSKREFIGGQAFCTIEPVNLETILSTKVEDWNLCPRREPFCPWLGDDIFTRSGTDRKCSQETLQSRFDLTQYDDLSVLRGPVDQLLQILPQAGVVDLQPYFVRLSLDITTAFLFGDFTGSLGNPVVAGAADFASVFNSAQEFMAKRPGFQDPHSHTGSEHLPRILQDFHVFVDYIIDRNLSRQSKNADEQKNYTFLGFLARNVPDRKALRSHTINILFAGKDTAAYLISRTLSLLVRHPRVMQKLRDEINAKIAERTTINRSHLTRLEYLQNILKETLRLYPPVPVDFRTAVRDTLLPAGGGLDLQSPVVVPKGTSISYDVYSMHRRTDLYGMDAGIFRPERWEEHLPLRSKPINSRWGYLPFGGGPRICLGVDFGVMEAAYTIVRLLLTYPNISLPLGVPADLVWVEQPIVYPFVPMVKDCNVNLGK